MKFKEFKPLITNSKNVFKFSGEGAVTIIFEYPYTTAPATAKPILDDFPLPLPDVRDTVFF